jgi:hypothetical protein
VEDRLQADETYQRLKAEREHLKRAIIERRGSDVADTASNPPEPRGSP